MQTKLVLWGASSHASVIADIVRLRGDYEIVGFLDDISVHRHNTEFCGAMILGGAEQLDTLKGHDVSHLLMAFGANRARLRAARLARLKGYALATAIHPMTAIAAGVEVGEGTVIMAGAVVNAGVRIGENAIINSSAIVEHECVIQDGVHVSAGARLGGNVTVGPATTIEIGAIVGARVIIGADSVIGAGAVVLRDIPDGVLAYGIPARVIRKTKPDDG
ncbi:MAG: acetyltransferase [Pyrinomonadaceae bacterium]|nr:acetyltransferase [Pyrinomonadaceae bacterium]